MSPGKTKTAEKNDSARHIRWVSIGKESRMRRLLVLKKDGAKPEGEEEGSMNEWNNTSSIPYSKIQ
jgi:hypothetical protein